MGLAKDLADIANDARQQLYETNEQLRVGHTVEQTVAHGDEFNRDTSQSQEHDNQQVQQQNQQQEIER